MKKETYEWLLKVTKIANRAMKKTQEENKNLGLPNVYFKDGKLVFAMPNGKVKTNNPFIK